MRRAPIPVFPADPRSHVSAALLCCLLQFPAAGCSRSESGGDVAALPSLAAVEDLRIGSIDDPDRGFSSIGLVDVDRDGQVFVYETTDRQIRVYDDHGAFVRAIGRRGEGPGEFGMVVQFGVTGDTIWTWDFMQRRLTLFDRAGTVLTTANMSGVPVLLQRPGMVGSVTPRALRPDGLFTSDMNSIRYSARTPDEAVRNDTVMVPRILFDATGGVVDTVGWFAFPPRPSDASQNVEIRGTRFGVPQPPSDEELRTMMDDGGYLISRARPTTAEPTEFTVTRVAESGDTLFQKRFRYTPARCTSTLLDTMAWRSVRMPRPTMFTPAGPARAPADFDVDVAWQEIRDAMDWPEFQIPVEQAPVGRDGTLWLRREDDGGPDYRYMVLDAEGQARGILSLPRGLSIRWISADRFWAVDTDVLGVPWLVRFRYD